MNFRNKVRPKVLTATFSTLLFLFNLGCSKDNAVKTELKSGQEKTTEQKSREKSEREKSLVLGEGFEGNGIVKANFDGKIFKTADLVLLDISGKPVGYTELVKDKNGNLVGDIYVEGPLREAEGSTKMLFLLSEMYTGKKECSMESVYGKQVLFDGEDIELREMDKSVIYYYAKKYRGK